MKHLVTAAKFYPLFLLSLGLVGCTALKQNVVVSEPTSGPRARVRVVIPNEGAYRGVRAFPNSACASRDLVPGNGTVANVQIAIGFEKTLNGQKLGIPDTLYTANERFIKSEFYAAANQPITFANMRVSDEYSSGAYRTILNNGCTNQVSFVPEEGADYELVFGEDFRCQLASNKLKIVAGKAEPLLEPIKMENAPTCKREAKK